jgi:transcriptional regulator with XRE-family HTH domain
MIDARTLKCKRTAAGIPGSFLCQKLGIARSRLSDIERGHVIASHEELSRMNDALDGLIQAKFLIDHVAESVGWPSGLSSDHLEALLAERVMHWGVAPDRFLKDGRRWMPRWRFQPTKNLENAIALLEAADPAECNIVRHRHGDWSVTLRTGENIGKAQDGSQPRAITLAVAQALGLNVTACE